MDTTPLQIVDGRRRRRKHSDEFKASAIAACNHPGVSVAAVAMTYGLNANMLRIWVKAAEMVPAQTPPALTAPPSFVPLDLPPRTDPAEIRIELRRGATAISVTWPSHAAPECAVWMRELLR